MMVVKSRARSTEQKRERRSAILKAAVRLFTAQPIPEISMDAIAQAAGVAKGTIYLYFSTKEAVFLTLLGDLLSAWFDRVNDGLASLSHAGKEEVVALFVHASSAPPELIRLIAIAHTVLEQNVDAEELMHHKKLLQDGLLRTGSLLEARLALTDRQGVELLLIFYALLIGFEQLAAPGPRIAAVLQSPDMQVYQIDFEQSLSSAFRAVLTGMGIT